jgi:hypothetical protein
VRLLDYLAPEEAGGQAATIARHLFRGCHPLRDALGAAPEPEGRARRRAPATARAPELDAVVLRAVAPNPDSRPQSAAAFASELRGVLALIDSQGGATDEADESRGPATNSGRVLLLRGHSCGHRRFCLWLWQSRGS